MSNALTSTIELESDDQRTLREREWRAEAIGWFAMAVLVVLAILGLTGPGLLSHRQETADDGSLAIEYYAIERYDAPAEMRIQVRRSEGDQSPIRLVVSRSFRDKVQLENFTPEPVQTELKGSSLVYVFAVNAGDPKEIVLQYKSMERGRLEATIGLENHSSVDIGQFVCP